MSVAPELRNHPASGSYYAAVVRAVADAGHQFADVAGAHTRIAEADVYVGVLGTRYSEPLPRMPQWSFPELAHDAALEFSLTCLVFLLDTESEETGLPASALLDREHGERQDRFRLHAQDWGTTVQLFGSSAELGRLAGATLRDLAATGVVRPVHELVDNLPPAVRVTDRGALNRLAALMRDEPVVAVGASAGREGLAVQYARSHRHRHGLVWCVPAGSAESVSRSLAELAGRLRLETRDGPRAAALHWLRHGEGWLLILAGVGDLADVEELLTLGGQVLLTSDEELGLPRLP